MTYATSGFGQYAVLPGHFYFYICKLVLKMNKIFAGLLLFALVVFGYYYFFLYQSVPPSAQQQSPGQPVLNSLSVQGRVFVATGYRLGRVEVWGIPTGTGVTPDSYQLLGDMKRASSSGAQQNWRLPVPDSPLLLTQVFARGYGGSGATTSDVYLPETGATALYQLLWGSTDNTGEAERTTLRADDSGKVFVFHPTDRFALILPKTVVASTTADCSPQGVLGMISNIPTVPDTDSVTRFAAVSPGVCMLTWGNFKATVRVISK
jgi:hypothetical protein